MRRLGVLVGCWMLAEPVPVLRPGEWEMGVDGRDGAGVASGTGRTKSGLNRTASHTSSIQETQLETMISPARGFHFSGEFDSRVRFLVAGRTGMRNRPIMHRMVRPMTKVRRCSMTLDSKGIGARRKESGGTKSKKSKKRPRIRVDLRMPMITRTGRNAFDRECGETGVKNG